MTATPETAVTADDKPHAFLAGLAQQAGYAYRFAKAGSMEEAAEHLGAIERLIAAYRMGTGEWDTEAIHLHFSLSYANYMVLPRTLLQSMPDEWQARFVALVDELGEAFGHVPQAEAYKVQAAREHDLREMTDSELYAAGVLVEGDGPDGPGPNTRYHSAEDGRELDGNERILLPVPDPVPHYNRGRARVEPRLDGGE